MDSYCVCLQLTYVEIFLFSKCILSVFNLYSGFLAFVLFTIFPFYYQPGGSLLLAWWLRVSKLKVVTKSDYKRKKLTSPLLFCSIYCKYYNNINVNILQMKLSKYHCEYQERFVIILKRQWESSRSMPRSDQISLFAILVIFIPTLCTCVGVQLIKMENFSTHLPPLDARQHQENLTQ